MTDQPFHMVAAGTLLSAAMTSVPDSETELRWAVRAQAHATLAAAEQARLANLLTLADSGQLSPRTQGALRLYVKQQLNVDQIVEEVLNA
jgi:hypothetical protein